jgi:hypothetical protein
MRKIAPSLAAFAALLLTASAAMADESHAVVNANGTLVRGDDVTGTQRTATGRYVVTFDSSVRTCAFVASVGPSGTGTIASGVATVGGASNARQVRVETRTLAGAYANRPFHLVLICDDDDD